MQFRFYILSILFLLNLTYAESQRGMWVVRHALKSDAEIEKLIRISSDLDITDLYVQVYALGESYLRTPKNSNQDTYRRNNNNFKKVLRFAKANQIKVHAWLNMFYVWSRKKLLADPMHPIRIAEKSILRSPELEQLPDLALLQKMGIEGYFIDPIDREYRTYIKNIITNLCSFYSLDGIHLDYIRYPQKEVSFSPQGRTEFMMNHFVDPVDGFIDSEEYIQKQGFDTYNHLSQTYYNFLNQNLSSFLNEITNHIKYFDSDLIVSCAVKSDLFKARHTFVQNWDEWLVKNYCDRVLMMNYDTVSANFVRNLENPRQDELRDRIVIGISTYNQSEQAVIKRINWTKQYGYGGYALFSFNHLSETSNYMERIAKLFRGGKYKKGLLPTSF